MSNEQWQIVKVHALAQAAWMLIGMKLFHVWQSWLWGDVEADFLTFLSTALGTLANAMLCAERCDEYARRR